jgi:hypothetical protein
MERLEAKDMQELHILLMKKYGGTMEEMTRMDTKAAKHLLDIVKES